MAGLEVAHAYGGHVGLPRELLLRQTPFETPLTQALAELLSTLLGVHRHNYLMLSVLVELHFEGVRVVSVADGLDSNDEEATLGIQIRGIFNELQLRDLKKKTLRGQISQKQRGVLGRREDVRLQISRRKGPRGPGANTIIEVWERFSSLNFREVHIGAQRCKIMICRTSKSLAVRA